MSMTVPNLLYTYTYISFCFNCFAGFPTPAELGADNQIKRINSTVNKAVTMPYFLDAVVLWNCESGTYPRGDLFWILADPIIVGLVSLLFVIVLYCICLH